MKLILLICLLALFTVSADAVVTKNVSVKVNIFKNSNSAELFIEADHDMYTAIYSAEKESFLDLNMGFTLSSPVSSTGGYKIELMGSEHQCDSKPIDVDILFDDIKLDNDLTGELSFQDSDDDIRSSWHQFTLIYPDLLQTDNSQQCSGSLNILASLVL
ncbi:MAG: hypothetical protein V5786_09450 [Psychromonas sp.]